MPGLDVQWLAQPPVTTLLAACGEGKDAVIVAVSGYGQEEDRQRAREAGFDHHVTKPLDPAVLFADAARVEAVGADAGHERGRFR